MRVRNAPVRPAALGPRRPAGRVGGAPTLLVIAAGLIVLLAFGCGRLTAGPDERQPAVAADPGPRQSAGPAGMPAGFAHRPAGAASAAVHYIQALANPDTMLSPKRIRAALQAVGVRGFAGRYLAGEGRNYRLLARAMIAVRHRQGAAVLSQAQPLAYRVVRYTPDAAVVRCWCLIITAADVGWRPQAYWTRQSVVLRWDHDDWKLAGLHTQPGPAPARGIDHHRPTPARAFFAQLTGLRKVRYAP